MSESIQKLTIDWQMPSPPVKPKEWRPVSPGPRSTGSEILGSRLGLGPAGLDCLDAAFKLGLNRYTGWDVGKEEYAKAALVYKRGVHWRCNDTTSHESTQSGSYDITILPSKEDFMEQLAPYKSWAFVIDENVDQAWSDLLSGFDSCTIVTNEIGKNLMTVAQITEEIEDKEGVVIIGGGILGDMAGFAAALSGMPMVLVPTTLLAMADACVGGKTGVNYPPHGKNQVGAFYFPKEVLVWTGWLGTLDERNVNAGIAECIKHMFLSGNMQVAEQIAKRNYEQYISQIIKVKADVVAQDPAELGLRASLNFGHTLGHAIEAISHARVAEDKIIFHGEAVAVGMAYTLLLCHEMALMNREDLRRMGQILIDAKILPSKSKLSAFMGVKLDSPDVWPELYRLIKKDKKAGPESDTTNWVLLKRPGELVKGPDGNYLVPVKEEVLKTAWDFLLASL